MLDAEGDTDVYEVEDCEFITVWQFSVSATEMDDKTIASVETLREWKKSAKNINKTWLKGIL